MHLSCQNHQEHNMHTHTTGLFPCSWVFWKACTFLFCPRRYSHSSRAFASSARVSLVFACWYFYGKIKELAFVFFYPLVYLVFRRPSEFHADARRAHVSLESLYYFDVIFVFGEVFVVENVVASCMRSLGPFYLVPGPLLDRAFVKRVHIVCHRKK